MTFPIVIFLFLFCFGQPTRKDDAMESWTLRPCATYCFSQLNEMHIQLSNAMELEVFRMEPHRILHPGTPSIHDIEVRMLLCCVKYHLRLPINSTTCPRYDLLKFVLHMCGTIHSFLKTKLRLHFLWRKRLRAVNDTPNAVPYCNCSYPKLCLVSLQKRVGAMGVFDITFSCPMNGSIDEDGRILGCLFVSCNL